MRNQCWALGILGTLAVTMSFPLINLILQQAGVSGDPRALWRDYPLSLGAGGRGRLVGRTVISASSSEEEYRFEEVLSGSEQREEGYGTERCDGSLITVRPRGGAQPGSQHVCQTGQRSGHYRLAEAGADRRSDSGLRRLSYHVGRIHTRYFTAPPTGPLLQAI
ncbi:hypothetical protein AAFF_G00032560 [Aldrovandia affinis]|uniref:Uncharacterized protein n=1 Tax=Aldrovandia affinis TaxID=143900 RepID=A0AAD7S405_9TELE|nr:hypothetical protein AAFF_G00032560 [Aldrovandia affinis]